MEKIEEGFLSAENELPIDNEASASMVEASKWTKFIAITIYIIIGLILLVFMIQGRDILYAFSQLALFSDRVFLIFTILGVILVVVVAAYYYLLNFANKIKAGVEMQDIVMVNEGLKSLNIHLIILAILSALTTFLTLVGMFNY